MHYPKTIATNEKIIGKIGTIFQYWLRDSVINMFLKKSVLKLFENTVYIINYWDKVQSLFFYIQFANCLALFQTKKINDFAMRAIKT